MTRLQEDDAPIVGTIEQVLADLADAPVALPATASQWPNAEWFQTTASQLEEGQAQLAALIGQALSDYRQAKASVLCGDGARATLIAINAVQERFRRPALHGVFVKMILRVCRSLRKNDRRSFAWSKLFD